jgi:hypothetical protein
MSKRVTSTFFTGKIMNSYELRAGVTETLKARYLEDETIDPRDCLSQVERLASSPLLRSSQALCKLLRYLAYHTLNSPEDHLKEYQIAIEVFGRSPTFDPHIDSSVRVQVGRLRSKLAEYYNSHCTDDLVLIDVPKGRYALSFQRWTVAAEPETAPEAISKPSGPTGSPQFRRGVAIALAILVVALLGSAMSYLVHRKAPLAAIVVSHTDPVPSPLQTFWSPFLQSPEKPFVVFSNAIFLGSPQTGMRYFEPSRDSRDQITQHYTGVGEVMGVLELERQFDQFGRQFQIKQGGLFTLDDARHSNLIFVGSPTENLSLGQIPNTREFVFRRLPSGPNRWNDAIVDLHPRFGENGIFLRTPPNHPLEMDYSVIALMHGLDRSRWTLILAGISTIGTQGAVDYVCDKSAMKELLRRLNVASGGDLKPFEALLRIKVKNDVPLETELVAVHMRTE